MELEKKPMIEDLKGIIEQKKKVIMIDIEPEEEDIEPVVEV